MPASKEENKENPISSKLASQIMRSLGHRPSDFKCSAKKHTKYYPREYRRCVNCGNLDTPQWRKGTFGPITMLLCNACGIHAKKYGICSCCETVLCTQGHEKTACNNLKFSESEDDAIYNLSGDEAI